MLRLVTIDRSALLIAAAAILVAIACALVPLPEDEGHGHGGGGGGGGATDSHDPGGARKETVEGRHEHSH